MFFFPSRRYGRLSALQPAHECMRCSSGCSENPELVMGAYAEAAAPANVGSGAAQSNTLSTARQRIHRVRMGYRRVGRRRHGDLTGGSQIARVHRAYELHGGRPFST